ncbi:MAG: GIY-YIG nuclease family protein [Rhodospirillaceae bacterium]
MTHGRSIRLFLCDGSISGIITAEIINWTGHVMLAPRSRLPDLLQRGESERTGIYFLTSLNDEGAFRQEIYIGETDLISRRLPDYNRDETKEFWDRVCVVTSKDFNLTKAHVRYLEFRLISIATAAGRATLLNRTEGTRAMALPEADIADMEFFIEQIRLIFPVLGMGFLRDAPRPSEPPAATIAPEPVGQPPSPIFELNIQRHGLHAEAREIGDEFVVLAGSLARRNYESTHHETYKKLHSYLKEKGILEDFSEDKIRFKTDYAFTKPSAAAAVIVGRPENGRTAWKLQGTDTTYADWQEAQVAAVTPPGGEP